MRTHVIAYIECAEMDLRDNRAFERAAEFARHPCSVTIKCSNGQEITVQCNPDSDGDHCWGWRYFRRAWERKYGPV